MSILDSFVKQRFNAAKCKTLLKLTIPRIKLLRNRREIQIKQMRKEIAKLLETGQEATARIRVEHIIREEKMMAAQEIVELFCELISVRLPIIEVQRECPLDLKEAISSVCFAAPRCADLPELLQVQMLFAGKYGKEFVAAATELMPECGVNRQLVELLSIRAPAPDVKLKLLKEIAEEHELDWDASATENELLKSHEDLLNGPTKFVSGARVPLPEEKHDNSVCTTSVPDTHKHSDSDEDFHIVDLPEVPKQPLPSNKGTVSAPEMLPFGASALSEVDDQGEPDPFGGNKNLSYSEEHDNVWEKSVTKEDASLKTSTSRVGEQFVPFISPPPVQSSASPVKEQNSPPSMSKTRNDNADLQDVLAAAQAASETAERAAAAARSAASIAQLRISELIKKKNDEASVPSSESPFQLDKTKSDMVEQTDSGKHNLTGDADSATSSPSQSNGFENYINYQPTAHPQDNDPHVVVDSPSRSSSVVTSGTSPHQPQRLPSMDDEMYLSYPNLFTSQGSNLGTAARSFTDSK